MPPELLTLTMTSYHTSLQVRSQSPELLSVTGHTETDLLPAPSDVIVSGSYMLGPSAPSYAQHIRRSQCMMHELTELIKNDLLRIAMKKDKLSQYRKRLKLRLIPSCLSCPSTVWVSPHAKQEPEQ